MMTIASLLVLLLFFMETFVHAKNARTPMAVKEALKKAKTDSSSSSSAADYVPPELDQSTENEGTDGDEDAEEIREKMAVFDHDGLQPTIAPSSSTFMRNMSREASDEDADDVRQNMDAFQSQLAEDQGDEITPAAAVPEQQQEQHEQKQKQEPEFTLSEPGVVTKLQEWSYKTKTFKKNEKVLITLSKFDNRKQEQTFPDIQYKIDLRFQDRTCRFEYLNETFKSGSGEYLTTLVTEEKIGPDEIFAQIEGKLISYFLLFLRFS